MCDDCVLRAAAQIQDARAAGPCAELASEEDKSACHDLAVGAMLSVSTAASGPGGSMLDDMSREPSVIEIFEFCDVDGNGVLSLDEIEVAASLGLLKDGTSPEDRLRVLAQLRNGVWAEGFTMLHWAAANDRPRLAEHLLARGSDPLEKDATGKSAWDYAQMRGDQRVLAEFIAHKPALRRKCASAESTQTPPPSPTSDSGCRSLNSASTGEVTLPTTPSGRRPRLALSQDQEEAFTAALQVHGIAEKVKIDGRREQLKKLFYQLDIDGDGRLSPEEVAAALKAGHLKEVAVFLRSTKAVKEDLKGYFHGSGSGPEACGRSSPRAGRSASQRPKDAERYSPLPSPKAAKTDSRQHDPVGHLMSEYENVVSKVSQTMSLLGRNKAAATV